jgi:hypothetical protein
MNISYLITMRRECEYSEYQTVKEPTEKGEKIVSKLVVTGKAYFLGFGIEYEELDNTVGQYSTAIIELQDGTVKNVPVEHIRFLEPTINSLFHRRIDSYTSMVMQIEEELLKLLDEMKATI